MFNNFNKTSSPVAHSQFYFANKKVTSHCELKAQNPVKHIFTMNAECHHKMP